MDKQPSPSLLPILRSHQQAEILTLLLCGPDTEMSLTEIASRTVVPYASVHREIDRAEASGLTVSRKIGNTRLVRANTQSPYYRGLSEILVRAFGAPRVLADALKGVPGVREAWIYGSWAAQFLGEPASRPVADIDVLVLGSPDRERLYRAVTPAEARLGRVVEITVRDVDWLERGTGPFHGTVSGRPMVEVPLSRD